MEKYETLKNQYPEFISLDQLYRICRIAKRSALYLIQHGIIPAIDTGRTTWRYKIAIDDVITYLQRREQTGSMIRMIPMGAVTSRRHKQTGGRSIIEYDANSKAAIAYKGFAGEVSGNGNDNER